MIVKVLYSGSKGNCTYIETKESKILIDAGFSYKRINTELENINRNIKDIDLILITHDHKDHISGINQIIKRETVKFFLPKDLIYEEDDRFIKITSEPYILNDLVIQAIKTSHDSPSSFGFIVSSEEKELVYITDTGYINVDKYSDCLQNKDIYIFESNHDPEMLINSKYPPRIITRIASDRGHLSNSDSAKYLSEFIGDKTKYIVLAHLSEQNNTEELALSTLKSKLTKTNKHVDNILVARQDESLELIEI